MNLPRDLRYSKTHEWARKLQDRIVIGITDYAQHEISDVVFVELPKVGQEVAQAKAISVVESVKAAFDIYAPVSGTVKSINTALESDPSLVNRDPYGSGWFFEIAPSEASEWDTLLTHNQYEEFLQQATH
jgi:glycine cleavage system H protein